MHPQVVTILPITKGKSAHPLSYFTTKEVSPGMLVTVPYRTQELLGLVILVKKISEDKASLKSAVFSLKKITSIHKDSLIPLEFFEACKDVALYTCQPYHKVVSDMYPKHAIEAKLTSNLLSKVKQKNQTPERYILQASEEERFQWHKMKLRELFAQKKSYVITAPTPWHAKKIQENLQKGIELYTVLLHDEISKKKITENIKTISESKHPLLVIATPLYISYIPKNTHLISVEFEMNQSYRYFARTHIDTTIFIERFAMALSLATVRSDEIVNYTTYQAYKDEIRIPVRPVALHLPETLSPTVIDMREYGDNKEILHESIHSLLTQNTEAKKIIIYCARNSLATTIVCNDCGTTVCHDGVPVVLRNDPASGERIFWSPVSGIVSSAKKTCEHCGSWNLVALGITTQKVEEIVEQYKISHKIIRLDREQITTHKALIRELEQFYNADNAVLITTEFALPYIQKKVDYSIIASLDSLLMMPNYTMYEKILRLTFTLARLSTNPLIFQTRQKNHEILSYIKDNGYIQLLEEDLRIRKLYGYPPYSTIIRILLPTPSPHLLKKLQEYTRTLEENMTDWKTDKTGAIICSIRVTHTEWNPEPKTMREQLLSHPLIKIILPYTGSIQIEINPESLLQ